MLDGLDDAALAPALDAIYDAAVTPQKWLAVLEHLSILFTSPFADVFARTDDRSEFRGRAVGLDRGDYEDQFLGTWCKRNVWGAAKPVRHAGEVLATWQILGRPELLGSEIYNEYLKPRGLHEGLRLAIWSGDGWIQDISLLRPWSAGPFGHDEIAVGRRLLPHLQRAASVSRRLQALGGFSTFETARRAAFQVDRLGRIVRLNAAADILLARGDTLIRRDGRLTAPVDAAAAELNAAIAAAGCIATQLPRATRLALRRASPLGLGAFDVIPVREDAEWGLPGPRTVMILATGPEATERFSAEDLRARFGLTQAEADFTIDLMAGVPLPEIAVRTGRSVHTLRTHLARVMHKTHTRRQSDLIRFLIGEATTQPGPLLPH